MNDIFNQMLQEHDLSTVDGQRNATYEVMQQVVLSGLYRSGFFKEAAFYGGTCLRIFHNLGRYSEDMDFSLLEKNPDFHFEDYFPAIIEEAKLLGRDVTITGIAAAVERSEVNLGDIMIASKVWDGASGKIKTSDDGNDIFSPDYHELTLDTDMLGIANRIKVNRALLNQIEESYTYTRGKPGNKLNVHIGPIASVPAVLASRDEVEKIKIHCRKLLGIEMEGYGVFYAANNSAHPRPKYTVLLKSVSDYSDSEKSDNYQDYAMYTSASLAKHIVTSQLEYD